MITSFKQKYFKYQPGEFMPIYLEGKLQNKIEYHLYRIKWILKTHTI